MPDQVPSATSADQLAAAIHRRVTELRVAHPQAHGVTADLLFLAYLIETARFGLFSFGPITIDVALVEDLFVRSLPREPAGGPQRMSASAHAFYGKLAEELERSGTRRANELHYLLAFMRLPEGLPAKVFGELGVRPEAVEQFSRNAGTNRKGEAFLTPEDVAERLSVNVQTVRAWIRSGKLPASRLAGRRVLRIRESDLEAVLEPVDPTDFA